MMKHLRSFKIFESVGPKWYHGTSSDFEEFNEPSGKGSRSLGIWSTDDEELASMFGDHVLEVKLDYKKPYKISADKWNEIRDDHATDTSYFLKWRDKLIADGYDALFVEEDSWTASSGAVFKDPNIVAVFYASQIRIA